MNSRIPLNHLINHGLKVSHVNGKIRLSPYRLINDKVIQYATDNKDAIVAAIEIEKRQFHDQRKASLGDRVEIFRILLRRFLATTERQKFINFNGAVTDANIETLLDLELVNFEYDLEAAITMYRAFLPASPSPYCGCGYVTPFCSCPNTASDIVSCDSCKNFTPDSVGDGSGIGDCSHNIESTVHNNKNLALFRYAERKCNHYEMKHQDYPQPRAET